MITLSRKHDILFYFYFQQKLRGVISIPNLKIPVVVRANNKLNCKKKKKNSLP